MASQVERILILAKTYPSPSAGYGETSCVAGINDSGMMRRLYPVPFRFIVKNQQFQKWQWVNARIERASKDHRKESHRIYVDTIQCGETITTKNQWANRRPWIEQIPSFSSFDEIEACRQADGLTLALLRPKQILELVIEESGKTDWTDEERAKLVRLQMQEDLFREEEAARDIKLLRKIPCSFYYRYVCHTPQGYAEFKHKIVDWEAGALYWNCIAHHGDKWERPFREMFEEKLPQADFMMLMGNMHQFPHQWLIISVIYPPKRPPAAPVQTSLF